MHINIYCYNHTPMSLIAAWFRRPHPKLSALAGYMLLWIAVGNLIGHSLVVLQPDLRHSCYPYWSVFGALETRCESGYANLAWALLVGIPRIFGAFFSLTLGAIMIWSEHIIPWIVYAAITALLIIRPGFLYWKRRNPYIAWGCLICFFGLAFSVGGIR